MEEAIATIKGSRLPKQSKAIEDPSDWEDLESTIRHHMEQKIQNICVNYTVTYTKTRRRGNSGQMMEEEDSEGQEDSPARKRQKSNVCSHV